MSPHVTVLMAVYNGAPFLAKAIDSILAQTYEDFELLVVDDGSTDATPDIVRSYGDRRVRTVRNPRNIGLARSLNVGLAEARGALVARHDADDLSYPDRFRRQVEFLAAHPDVAVLGTRFDSIDQRGRRRPLHLWMKCETSVGIRWQMIFENPLVHSSVMFRRDIVVGEFQGYDDRFPINQDFELWARIARRYPLRNLPESLVALRGSSTSMSGRATPASMEKVREVCAAYARDIVGLDQAGEAGLDALLQGMSPEICPPLRTLRPVVRWIDESYQRFVARWPEAEETGEIRAQAASLIARLATLSVGGSPAKMSRWYLEAARYDLPTFARGLVRFTASGGRGLVRRLAHARSTE